MSSSAKQNELLDLLKRGEPSACVAFFKDASEESRKKLAPQALKCYRDNPPKKVPQQFECEKLAVLATASLGQLKRLSHNQPFSNDKNATYGCAILLDRRPNWLEEWLQWVFAEGNFYSSWQFIYELEQNSLFDGKKNADIAVEVVRKTGLAEKSLREEVLSEPLLLNEYIWRLFEFEEAGNRLNWHDSYAGPTMEMKKCGPDEHAELRWDHTLARLARDRRIPRARLLDASLDAMTFDTLKSAGWYAPFHEMLDPTVGERADRLDRYLRLLACKQAPTMEVAHKALATLAMAKHLPPERYFEQIGPVLSSRPKSTVKRFLQIGETLIQQQSACGESGVRAVIDAFDHEASDVHMMVLEFLERFGSNPDPDLVEKIQGKMRHVAASQRDRLLKWIDAARSVKTHVDVEKQEPSDEDVNELITRAKALPEKWTTLAGVTTALNAIRGDQPDIQAIPPDTFENFEVPRLDPQKGIELIQDLDALIDLLLAVLEGQVSADEVERALDGLSRLCNQRPANFSERTDSLRKRALDRMNEKSFLEGWEARAPKIFRGENTLADVAAVALSWVAPTELDTFTQMKIELDSVATKTKKAQEWFEADIVFRSSPIAHFYSRRLLEIARRVAKRQALPLLAAPTHRGGWIDPLQFISRVQQHRPTIDEYSDLIQAVLRLAPDHRDEALLNARGLSGEVGAVIRYALGGDEKVGVTAPLWVAAARSRSPYSDDDVVEAKHSGLGPNTGKAARWTVTVRRWSNDGRNGKLGVGCKPERTTKTSPALPTVLMTASYGTDWDALIWPFDRESLFAQQVTQLPLFMESIGTFWQTDWDPLFDPDTAMRPVAKSLLGLGLSLRNPSSSRLALDALIATIGDGRIGGVDLGEILASLALLKEISPHRWLKALKECAQISALHAQVVRIGIEKWVASGQFTKPEFPKILELWHELCVEADEGVNDSVAREQLSTLGGGGKSGKLAKAILSITSSGKGHRIEAACYALEKRIERAERYARSDGRANAT
jgi:hypothetical protein